MQNSAISGADILDRAYPSALRSRVRVKLVWDPKSVTKVKPLKTAERYSHRRCPADTTLDLTGDGGRNFQLLTAIPGMSDCA
jgi:hypothetical protein